MNTAFPFKAWLALGLVTIVLDFGLMYLLDGPQAMKQIARQAIDRFGYTGYFAGIVVADILVPPLGLASIVFTRVQKRKNKS